MEKEKKPFYKRWWFIVVVVILVFNALINVMSGDNKDQEEVAEKETEKIEEDPKEAVEVEKTEEIEEPEENGIIEIDEQLTFAEFTVYFEQVKIEDDKAIITFKWLNQAGDGKQYFFALSGIDVVQGEDILDETSGAYDAENKNTSDIYFPNAENGETKVTLEYELKDKETPIDITFVPYNEYGEDSQKVTIEID